MQADSRREDFGVAPDKAERNLSLLSCVECLENGVPLGTGILIVPQPTLFSQSFRPVALYFHKSRSHKSSNSHSSSSRCLVSIKQSMPSRLHLTPPPTKLKNGGGVPGKRTSNGEYYILSVCPILTQSCDAPGPIPLQELPR